MIGRRGRYMTIAAAGVYYLYLHVAQDPKPNFATVFLQDNLFDGVVTSWILLGFYRVNGPLGALFYGPQSRVMDGMLARANFLLISTLWTLFKFVMVPIGIQLAAVFPKEEFAPVFGLIWGPYLATDASAEVFGSLLGRQRIPCPRHRGRQPQVGCGPRRGIRRGARPLRVDRDGERARHAVAGALADPRDLEPARRALLPARHRRLHDGHDERPHLPGFRRVAPLESVFKTL